MKRIQLLLFTVILLAIAAKVSFTPEHKAGYAALSIDTKLENVQEFFRYKVYNIQSENKFKVKSCMVKTRMCYHT